MLTLAAFVLSFLFLPSPWKIVVPVAVAVVDIAETGLVLWWSQRGQVRAGVETLVGRHAVAVGSLRPSGQVKLDGEIWEARSESPVDRGHEVVIRRVDGLVLDVAPLERAAQNGAPAEPGA